MAIDDDIMDSGLLKTLPRPFQQELLVLAILTNGYMMGREGFPTGRLADVCGLPREFVGHYLDILREKELVHRAGGRYCPDKRLYSITLYELYLLHDLMEEGQKQEQVSAADTGFSPENLRSVGLLSFLFEDRDKRASGEADYEPE